MRSKWRIDVPFFFKLQVKQGALPSELAVRTAIYYRVHDNITNLMKFLCHRTSVLVKTGKMISIYARQIRIVRARTLDLLQ